MKYKFNDAVTSIKPSANIVLMAKAKELMAVNPDVVDLAGGEPDFDTPQPIREELYKQVESGFTHYTVGTGLPELRAAIANKLNQENGLAVDENHIVVTPGGKYAIFTALSILLNPGDEVVYLNPGWVSYPSIIQACQCKPVAVNLPYSENYTIKRELLEEKITNNTKIIIINYPNNPTGRVLTREEAEIIRQIMLDHPKLILVSDEMYERIVFEGNENISPAKYPDIADRVITINGFSKSCAMTGWRIGYLVADPAVVSVAAKFLSHTITCTSGFIMKASIKAFSCQDEIEKMRKIYEQRRNLFVNGLNTIPGVHCETPEGAFYAWTKFELPGLNTQQIAEFLMNKAKVVGVPGFAYGENEKGMIRFSFATSTGQLKKAVSQIREAVEKQLNN